MSDQPIVRDAVGRRYFPIGRETHARYMSTCPRCGAPPGYYCNKERVGHNDNVTRLEPHAERPMAMSGAASDEKLLRRAIRAALRDYDPRKDTHRDVEDRIIRALSWSRRA